jgi:protein-disulfide isomerase
MRFIRLAALAAAAVLVMGAGKPLPARPSAQNWTGTVTVTESGSHVLGNPGAPVKLAEYVSYTCSHCAQFQIQSDAPLRIAYVQPGKVSVEVRHLVRDPIDLTAAMLANCGDPNRFFTLHNAFLQSQERWMKVAQAATPGQQQRWTAGDTPSRLRAIAGDLGFYALMQQRGFTRTQLDRCLADEPMMRRIVGQTVKAQELNVEGTPSFLLDGVLLAGTHDWPALEAQLRARF